MSSTSCAYCGSEPATVAARHAELLLTERLPFCTPACSEALCARVRSIGPKRTDTPDSGVAASDAKRLRFALAASHDSTANWADLPPELLVAVADHLPVLELVRASGIHPRWREAAEDNWLKCYARIARALGMPERTELTFRTWMHQALALLRSRDWLIREPDGRHLRLLTFATPETPLIIVSLAESGGDPIVLIHRPSIFFQQKWLADDVSRMRVAGVDFDLPADRTRPPLPRQAQLRRSARASDKNDDDVATLEFNTWNDRWDEPKWEWIRAGRPPRAAPSSLTAHTVLISADGRIRYTYDYDRERARHAAPNARDFAYLHIVQDGQTRQLAAYLSGPGVQVAGAWPPFAVRSVVLKVRGPPADRRDDDSESRELETLTLPVIDCSRIHNRRGSIATYWQHTLAQDGPDATLEIPVRLTLRPDANGLGAVGASRVHQPQIRISNNGRREHEGEPVPGTGARLMVSLRTDDADNLIWTDVAVRHYGSERGVDESMEELRIHRYPKSGTFAALWTNSPTAANLVRVTRGGPEQIARSID